MWKPGFTTLTKGTDTDTDTERDRKRNAGCARRHFQPVVSVSWMFQTVSLFQLPFFGNKIKFVDVGKSTYRNSFRTAVNEQNRVEIFPSVKQIITYTHELTNFCANIESFANE